MNLRGLLCLVVGLGCARSAGPGEGTPPAPFAQRLAANLAWQPGDAPPVHVERMPRVGPTESHDTGVHPMQLYTEIRNRCSRPAVVVAGPERAEPAEDVVGVSLEPGAAIQFWLGADEWLFVRVQRDAWRKVRGAGGELVLSGARCDELTDLRSVGPRPR